jgi:hypothetical protein
MNRLAASRRVRARCFPGSRLRAWSTSLRRAAEIPGELLRRAAATRLEQPRSAFELGFMLKDSNLLIGAGGIRVVG